VVECHLAKVKVASSNLVFRSTSGTAEIISEDVSSAVLNFGAIAKW
jgi:hypothetical protein